MSAAGDKLRHTAANASAAVLYAATWRPPDQQQLGVTFTRSMDCGDFFRVACASHVEGTEHSQLGMMYL